MTTSSFSSFNQTSGHGTTTATPHDVVLCPGIPNARFETLDSSVPYFVNAALNTALPITTTFANVLVLLSMRHVTSIRLPSKLLLCSLVLTDLGAGLVAQPQLAAFLFTKAIYPDFVQCALLKSLAFTSSLLTTASFCILIAISLDRYAALFFHLKYQQIVTTRRVCAVLAFIWSLSLFVASTPLWNFDLLGILNLTVTVVNFPVMSVVCIKIYRRLRAHQVQPQATDQAQHQAVNTLNMERYRRTASFMMLVYVLFLICYVPFWCSSIIVAASGYTARNMCLREFAYTVVLLNSFLNPFVYCLRLPEIRTEVMKQIRKLGCRSSPQ